MEYIKGGWNNVDSDPAWLEPEKSTVELIERVLADQPLIVRPGKAWIYSNFGYQLLGHVIERIAGMSYEQFVKKYIWERIGVKDIQVGERGEGIEVGRLAKWGREAGRERSNLKGN